MEGNFGPGTTNPHPRPSEANIGCNNELTRSNSDASSLTADNCREVFCCSGNVKLDDCTAWTDEKHNLYLHHLEVSFVKQLHQSKCLVAQCSEQYQRDITISQTRLIGAKNASEQFNVLRNGCWQTINCVRGEPLSNSTSADSRTPVKSKWMYNIKHKGIHCPPLSADMPDLKLPSTVKHGKQILSHGLSTGPQEFSSGNRYHRNLFDLKREGTGQNFSDENNQSTSNIESQAKRSKKGLSDIPSQDQIVPFRKLPTADYPVINSSSSRRTSTS